MQKDRVFYTSIISFFIGIAGYFILEAGIFIFVFITILSLGTMLYYIVQNIDIPVVFLIICALLALSCGFIRAYIGDSGIDATLDALVDENVVLEGFIDSEVRLRSNYREAILRMESGDGVRLSLDLHSNISYGDVIEVSGKLVKPKNFETSTGRVFDYVSYLERRNIGYQMFFPSVETKSHERGSSVRKILFGIKESFIRSLGKSVPEPHATLAGGITVGADDSLGKDLEDDLRRTGIIHIVVLSGYNVTIVSEFFIKIFAFLPLLWKSFLGALAIALFMIMTGASATIVRASIMAGLLILARITGRTADVTRLLFIAGFIMVLINPFTLLYDPSFQLSFLATLGLIIGTPYIERFFEGGSNLLTLKGLFASTVATQIFVLPLLLYMMGEVSVVSLIVNLLVLPIIPFAMLMGLVTGFTGFISSVLAFPFGFIEYLSLEYVFRVVEVFSSLSFASVSVPGFSLGWMFGVYVTYVALYIWIKRRFG